MNEEQRLELQQIRAEQRFLTARLAGLEQRLTRIESAGDKVDAPAADHVRRELRFAQIKSTEAAGSAIAPTAPPPMPPPMLPPFPPPTMPVAAKLPAAGPEPVGPIPPTFETAPLPTAESLEMRIGGTWFVRVGIVMLLTTLVFVGSYLYQHIVPHLGPAAKVGLLYLGAGALTGVGAALERSRQARESGRLRNYARVVLAGGLAAVYYVTYAAHYYDRLRVIESPVLAGTLLLAWAAFVVFLADRRGSETLATVAILLAYYTSAINEGVAGFTLVSNLLLTGGAVFLLRRHLWRVFPFASLLATFGSYAFWNYFHSYLGWRGLDAPPVHDGGRFWAEAAFLSIYWVLFTWAAFVARDEALPAARRAGFVSLNNGAFFLLTTWLVLGHDPHAFWKWSLGFGVALVALSEAGRRLPRRLDEKTEATYLTQGLLLVTLGFVTYFSGWQLSLMLAVQSVALLAGAGQRRSRVLLGGAYATGLLSFLWAVARLEEARTVGPWLSGLSEGGFLLLTAWWGERLLEKEGLDVKRPGGWSFHGWLVPVPTYFSLLGLGVWLWLIEQKVTEAAWNAPVLASAALVLTAGGFLLRMRVVPLYAQAYLLAAGIQWLTVYGPAAHPAAPPPWWNPAILLGATLALGHWWQRPRNSEALGVPAGRAFALWNAALLVLLLHAWLRPRAAGGDDLWIAETAGLALALLAYGLVSGYRALAVVGQWFLLVGAGVFLWHWVALPGGYRPALWLASGPWLGFLLTVAAARRFFPNERGEPWNALGAIYEVTAMGLFLAWTGEYFPRSVLFSLFCLVGGGVFALGVWRRERRWLLLSTAPTAAGLGVFWLVYGGADWRNPVQVLGVACLAAQQWWGRERLRKETENFPPLVHTGLIAAATLCAWALVTAWMEPWRGSAFGLAAAWSIFAAVIFAAGLALREKAYRWLGLVVLASTLGRIACIDIWQLDTLERIVSGACLSFTFLGLGYLYNRHHEKWRDLL